MAHRGKLHGYIDESGTDKNASVMCSGGYLFEPAAAATFRKKWKPYLDSKGLDCFHASECFRRKDGEEIFGALVEMINETAHRGFVKFAQDHVLTSMQPKLHQFTGSGYTLCTLGCMELMAEIAKEQKREIVYFVEDGNAFAGELRHFFNQIKADPERKAYFAMAGADTYPKRDVIQLQAADLLAWDFRRSVWRDRWTRSIIALCKGPKHRFHGFSETGAFIQSMINAQRGLGSNRKRF